MSTWYDIEVEVAAVYDWHNIISILDCEKESDFLVEGALECTDNQLLDGKQVAREQLKLLDASVFKWCRASVRVAGIFCELGFHASKDGRLVVSLGSIKAATKNFRHGAQEIDVYTYIHFMLQLCESLGVRSVRVTHEIGSWENQNILDNCYGSFLMILKDDIVSIVTKAYELGYELLSLEGALLNQKESVDLARRQIGDRNQVDLFLRADSKDYRITMSSGDISLRSTDDACSVSDCLHILTSFGEEYKLYYLNAMCPKN